MKLIKFFLSMTLILFAFIPLLSQCNIDWSVRPVHTLVFSYDSTNDATVDYKDTICSSTFNLKIEKITLIASSLQVNNNNLLAASYSRLISDNPMTFPPIQQNDLSRYRWCITKSGCMKDVPIYGGPLGNMIVQIQIVPCNEEVCKECVDVYYSDCGTIQFTEMGNEIYPNCASVLGEGCWVNCTSFGKLFMGK